MYLNSLVHGQCLPRIGFCVVIFTIAITSLMCIPPGMINPITRLELEVGGKKSNKPKIRLLEGKLVLQLTAEHYPLHTPRDELYLVLRINVESHDLESVLLYPDSIMVFYQDSEMMIESVRARKPSDTLQASNYRVIVSFTHLRDRSIESRSELDDPHNSWLKIGLSKFIKVSGHNVPIDTMIIAGE